MTTAKLTSNELIKLVYQETGFTAGSIFQEIYFLLRLKKGGIIRNGEKWIFKKADELAERFQLSERTVRRHLKVLVDEGWLKRAKHRAGSHRDQTYFYAIGRMDRFECPEDAEKYHAHSEERRDLYARHETAMMNTQFHALGDASKSRLETEELVHFQPEAPADLQPDTTAACIEEPNHSSNHSSVHRAARPETKTERPKKTAARLTAERIAAERELDKQLEEIDLSTRQGWIAAARAQAPILQKAQGFA